MKNKYSKEFNDLLEICDKNNEYVGLGNPNAKILIIGKEPGMELGTRITHGSAEFWKNNDYSKKYIPTDENLRNFNHTWQKYQKLYELILKKLNKCQEKSDKYEINFVENVFTTELSNLVAPNTKKAKEIEGFKSKLEKRKNLFFNSQFISNFPIVIIASSDNQYIETYDGEVRELFKVNFVKELNFGNSNKIWLHYSNNDKPKIVIHTRQLTNGASNELLEKIADLVVEFINENNINIKVK